jgi:predicted dehydrogenase
MQAGHDVLIELPLAATLEDAYRIIAAQQATGRQAFVDMFSRFSPANRQLRQAAAGQRHGPLRVLEIEGRTALLWPGYDLGLDTLAMDMMHADFDLVTSLLGQPSTIQATGTGAPDGRGSAAEVLLGYPQAFARCASSSLMPQPYQVRGGWRATFPRAVVEYTMRAGFTGEGASSLTEVTAEAERPIDLPDTGPPYAAVIDHTLACLTGDAGNLIEPATALPALKLTMDVHQRLTQAAS